MTYRATRYKIRIMEKIHKKNKPCCFAWISERRCNALVYKNCGNCVFYKHYSKVKGYEKYLPKNKFKGE